MRSTTIRRCRHLLSLACALALLPSPAAFAGDPGLALALPAPIYAGRPGGEHPFVVRRGSWAAGFGSRGATFGLELGDGTRARVDWRLAGQSGDAPKPEQPLAATVGEWAGPERQRRGLQGFRDVRCEEALPGVDLLWRSRPHALEWLLEAAPGQSSRRFVVEVEGVDLVSVDEGGSLRMAVGRGELVESGLSCSQERPEGAAVEVGCRYAEVREVAPGTWRYAIEASGLDPRLPLTVDPDLYFSLPFGGTKVDSSRGLCVLGSTLVLGGFTTSTDFPFVSRGRTDTDAFVTAIPTDLSSLESLYFGGAGEESMRAMACNAAGDAAYLTGSTLSDGLATVGTTTRNGQDAWLAKVSYSTGLRVDAVTYVGDTGLEEGLAVAMGPDGSVAVAGSSCTTGLCGPIDDTDRNAFVSVYSADLATPKWTYSFGGADGHEIVRAVAVTNDQVVHVAGWTDSLTLGLTTTVPGLPGGRPSAPATGFVVGIAKIGTAKPAIVAFSWIGGGGTRDSVDAMVTDGANLYLAGTTDSSDFEVVGAAFDPTFDVGNADSEGYALQLAHASSTNTWSIGWSTALGAQGMHEQVSALMWFGTDLIVAGGLAGAGSYANFPGLVGTAPLPSGSDLFLTRLSDGGQHGWSRIYGGPDTDNAQALAEATVGGKHEILLSGSTNSAAFPEQGAVPTGGAGDRGDFDAFVLGTDLTPPTVWGVIDGQGADVDSTDGPLVVSWSVAEPEEPASSVQVAVYFTESIAGGCKAKSPPEETFPVVLAGPSPFTYDIPGVIPTPNTTYYAVVRATNSAGLVSLNCSDGFVYHPSPVGDAGVVPDSGAEPQADASSSTPDVGGSPKADAGDSGSNGVLGWSCGCSAASGGWPALAGLLPALALLRRRRR